MPDLSFLKYITFCTLRVTFEAQETVSLPIYKGSAFRGSLGDSLLLQSCIYTNLPCKNGHSEFCPSRFDCVFSRLFNSYVPINHPHQRKFIKSPHPYIISPLQDEKTIYLPSETFGFEFTLIGNTIELFPLVMLTFFHMGKMGIGKECGKFTPIKLETLTQENGFIKIPFNSNPIIISFPIDSLYHDSTRISFIFESPLRLKKEGILCKSPPSFDFFIERLVQRMMFLAHFHCGAPWIETRNMFDESTNIKITESNLKWVDWQRYSGTQNTKMNFDGYIGKLTYEGKITPWLPLLVIGSYLHVGLTTTFGLGKYRILNER